MLIEYLCLLLVIHELSRMVSNTATCAAAEAAKLSNPSNPRFGNIWIRFFVISSFELICILRHPKKHGYPIPFVPGIYGSLIDQTHSALGVQWGWITKEACLQGHIFQVPLKVFRKQTQDCTALSQLLLSLFQQSLQQPKPGGQDWSDPTEHQKNMPSEKLSPGVGNLSNSSHCIVFIPLRSISTCLVLITNIKRGQRQKDSREMQTVEKTWQLQLSFL